MHWFDFFPELPLLLSKIKINLIISPSWPSPLPATQVKPPPLLPFFRSSTNVENPAQKRTERFWRNDHDHDESDPSPREWHLSKFPPPPWGSCHLVIITILTGEESKMIMIIILKDASESLFLLSLCPFLLGVFPLFRVPPFITRVPLPLNSRFLGKEAGGDKVPGLLQAIPFSSFVLFFFLSSFFSFCQWRSWFPS